MLPVPWAKHRELPRYDRGCGSDHLLNAVSCHWWGLRYVHSKWLHISDIRRVSTTAEKKICLQLHPAQGLPNIHADLQVYGLDPHNLTTLMVNRNYAFQFHLSQHHVSATFLLGIFAAPGVFISIRHTADPEESVPPFLLLFHAWHYPVLRELDTTLLHNDFNE